jgi:hypothetical protein
MVWPLSRPTWNSPRGPRMIHAIEQIAGYYAHLGHSLGLTAEQKDAMARLVQGIV